MKLAELQKKLTAAARLQPPDDAVPYAFEKRVMALIAERAQSAREIFWAQNLWRAAISCVAVAVLCGALSLFIQDSTESGNDLTPDLESTLLASVDIAEPTLP